MKSLVLITFSTFFLACLDQSDTEQASLSEQEVKSNDSGLQKNDGLLYLHHTLFSGRVVEQYEDGSRKQITSYDAGLQHGLTEVWYPSGAKMEERMYSLGKKEGKHRGWWENGELRFEYHFKDDRHEGSAKEWFDNGTLYRDFNYQNGYEEGRQQMWNNNGSIKANYVVREGRRYGSIGSKPCRSSEGLEVRSEQ